VFFDAADVVRWLITDAGASLEARDSAGVTTLLVACAHKAWAAAHALLDLGARLDVQSTNTESAWPVTLLAQYSDSVGRSVLQRALAADTDSLLRCADFWSAAGCRTSPRR
jgi:hypothetical protein